MVPRWMLRNFGTHVHAGLPRRSTHFADMGLLELRDYAFRYAARGMVEGNPEAGFTATKIRPRGRPPYYLLRKVELPSASSFGLQVA
jgi:hypothetical protein